jgi:hypothetical protein
MQRKDIFLSIFLIGALLAACAGGGTSVDTGGPAQDITPTPTPTPVFIGGGGNIPPGDFFIELEMTYLLVTTIGTETPVTFTTTIPLEPEITSDNLTASGEGAILDDVTFQIQEVTAHNVADWIIKVAATVDPNGGEEPLILDFNFNGQGYGSIQEVELGAHMDAGSDTYTYQLTMPLVDGASKSFDIEGWKDIKEWTVVLHLK